MQSDKGSKKAPKAGKGGSPRSAESAKKPETMTQDRKRAEPVEKVSAQHMHAPAAKSSKPTTAPAGSSARKAVRQEDVAQLAHSYWVERGHLHGSHEEDWQRAERELVARN